jgi:hypothetical protein
MELGGPVLVLGHKGRLVALLLLLKAQSHFDTPLKLLARKAARCPQHAAIGAE